MNQNLKQLPLKVLYQIAEILNVSAKEMLIKNE